MRVAAAMLLLVLWVPAARPGSAQEPSPWVRVTTERFAISAELPGPRAAEVARRLEQFRAALEQALPEGRLPGLVPTFVVVFATSDGFAPFRPSHPGGTAPVSGYVVDSEFAPCIALHFGRGDDSLRTVFHEYAHWLVKRAAPGVPLWFAEGGAEFYSTLALAPDGRSARLGHPVDRHVQLLRRRFVPLADLLDTARETANWQGPEGQLFYAESWALVHYLLAGHDTLARKVPDFLARLSAGTPHLRAFEEAFGPLAALERDLRRYVQRGAYPWRDLPVRPAEAVTLDTAPMSPASVDAALGRLLFHLQRDEAAEARLHRALARDASLFDTHLTLGLMRLRQGRLAEAAGSLERAQALQPRNLLVAYNLAVAALQGADALDDARLEAARAALAKLLPPGSRAGDPWAVLGALSGRLGRLEDAEPALRLALDLAPGRLATILELADVHVVLGRFDEAERLLESASGAAARTGTDLAPWRERVSRERGIARIRADLAKVAGPAAPPAGQAETPRTGRWLMPPDYRTLAAGEERAHGLLERIDCNPGRVVVQVATAEGPLRFDANSLLDVQSISYREDFDPLLACGPRRGRDPVFATWRPADKGTPAQIKGRLVALEFLGEEYFPRRRAR